MVSGATVWKGYVYSAITNAERPYYMVSAEVTDIVVDGKQMVRIHDSLFPADGWHLTQDDAKAAVRSEVVALMNQLQRAIDELPAASEVSL